VTTSWRLSDLFLRIKNIIKKIINFLCSISGGEKKLFIIICVGEL